MVKQLMKIHRKKDALVAKNGDREVFLSSKNASTVSEGEIWLIDVTNTSQTLLINSLEEELIVYENDTLFLYSLNRNKEKIDNIELSSKTQGKETDSLAESASILDMMHTKRDLNTSRYVLDSGSQVEISSVIKGSMFISSCKDAGIAHTIPLSISLVKTLIRNMKKVEYDLAGGQIIISPGNNVKIAQKNLGQVMPDISTVIILRSDGKIEGEVHSTFLKSPAKIDVGTYTKEYSLGKGKIEISQINTSIDPALLENVKYIVDPIKYDIFVETIKKEIEYSNNPEKIIEGEYINFDGQPITLSSEDKDLLWQEHLVEAEHTEILEINR